MQQLFYMQRHLFQRFIRALRLHQLYQLYLIELVQAVQTSHILTVASRLPPEAGCIGGHPDGQLLRFHDLITVNIGHRHLCCRDHIEIIGLHMVHLPLFVRELAGTIGGSGIDHMRRVILRIAACNIKIQEKADQRPLQTRALVDINRETGTRDLGAQLEIYQVIFSGNIPVRQRPGSQLRHRAACSHHFIVFRSFSFRNRCMRQVGNLHQQFFQPGFQLPQLDTGSLSVLFQAVHFRSFGFRLLFIPGSHQLTDLPGGLVDLRLERFRSLLDLSFLFIQSNNFIHYFQVFEILFLQTFNDSFLVLAEELYL